MGDYTNHEIVLIGSMTVKIEEKRLSVEKVMIKKKEQQSLLSQSDIPAKTNTIKKLFVSLIGVKPIT